jgi:2-amino-4-hydroxy-6-hydroxymethyldihydropteridine diphosphokinase
MNHAYLLTGGNLGNRAESLKNAVAMIAGSAGNVLQLSSLYETAAWGTKDQPDYLNQAVLLETKQTASDLLHTLLNIEKQLGRFRQEKYGARVIDIDILFFNNEIVKEHDLIIPHPHIQNRRFVLVPMVEIAPEYCHPILNKTMAELLEVCPDPLNVKKFRPLNAVK